MPTVEELQAQIEAMKTEHAEALKQAQTQHADRLRSAAKIQQAFLALQRVNKPAADYLDALASGKTPQPFWEQPKATPTVPPLVRREAEDLDLQEPWERAMERLREEQNARFEQFQQTLVAQIGKLAEPVSQIRASEAQNQAARAIDREYGAGTFERLLPKILERAEADESLLAKPNALVTLAEAEVARELKAQATQTRRAGQRAMIDATTPPTAPGRGDEGVSLDGFADTDLAGMATALFSDRLAEFANGAAQQ